MGLKPMAGNAFSMYLLKRESADAEKRRREAKHKNHPSKLYECPYLGKANFCGIGKGTWCGSCKNYGLGKRYKTIKGGEKNFGDHRFDKRRESFDRFLDKTGSVPWLYKDKRPTLEIIGSE